MSKSSENNSSVSDEERVQNMYNCNDVPLLYEIKPRGTIEFVDSDEITKEDFQDD